MAVMIALSQGQAQYAVDELQRAIVEGESKQFPTKMFKDNVEAALYIERLKREMVELLTNGSQHYDR